MCSFAVFLAYSFVVFFAYSFDLSKQPITVQISNFYQHRSIAIAAQRNTNLSTYFEQYFIQLLEEVSVSVKCLALQNDVGVILQYTGRFCCWLVIDCLHFDSCLLDFIVSLVLCIRSGAPLRSFFEMVLNKFSECNYKIEGQDCCDSLALPIYCIQV